VRRPRGEDGSSALEFVALSVLVVVPVLYLLLGLFRAQSAAFAVTEAAREAGRAYATGEAGDVAGRAETAARVAFADQGLGGVEPRLTWAEIAPGAQPSCAGASAQPPVPGPGRTVLVCVRATVALPFADRGVAGRALPGVEVSSRYVVPLDLLRPDSP
jgi:hypothetical protein